jgi:hypothetical protein
LEQAMVCPRFEWYHHSEGPPRSQLERFPVWLNRDSQGRQKEGVFSVDSTYRSPGRYESTYVRERLLDMAAERLGLDRIELRRRNLIASDEMPNKRRSARSGIRSCSIPATTPGC